MSKIAMFLDVDGVLNQYRISERKRRMRTMGYANTFEPFPKKIIKLAKLIKKYNIDVYVFSAWTIKDLQPHLPFILKGDTNKYAENVINIMKEYKYSILIDDELSSGLFGHERTTIPQNLLTYQPNYNYGLIQKDFKKINNLLKGLNK